MGDIRAEIIKGVGDPPRRFQEDALRMMRAIRFSGQLGFTIDPPTLAAIHGNASGLSQISAERIREELTKLLLSPHPEKLSLLNSTGLLGNFPIDFAPSQSEIQTASELLPIPVNAPKRIALTYSVLFSDRTPEQAGKALRALKFDNATIHDSVRILKYGRLNLDPEDYHLRTFLSGCGIEYFQDVLSYKRILRTNSDRQLALAAAAADRIIARGDCLTLRDLRINGDDLIGLGLAGKAVGTELKKLLDAVLQSPELNEKEKLLAIYQREVL
jgi:tRNA nucleotidyltransferase (CCA-adding enzyme)